MVFCLLSNHKILKKNLLPHLFFIRFYESKTRAYLTVKIVLVYSTHIIKGVQEKKFKSSCQGPLFLEFDSKIKLGDLT